MGTRRGAIATSPDDDMLRSTRRTITRDFFVSQSEARRRHQPLGWKALGPFPLGDLFALLCREPSTEPGPEQHERY